MRLRNEVYFGLHVYAGKNNNKNINNDIGLGLSGDVVVKLLGPYLNKVYQYLWRIIFLITKQILVELYVPTENTCQFLKKKAEEMRNRMEKQRENASPEVERPSRRSDAYYLS
ncbi:hypothetical protein NQ318_023545 [Aromia moschata]|uniref:Uncharacterized protein n=1 Tax=Aromia moschata TaxID=1265417 RepID=A0AAV8YR57_9CUCU|nr:hypothetical protein NQ318_023545 [Aromia moschata]